MQNLKFDFSTTTTNDISSYANAVKFGAMAAIKYPLPVTLNNSSTTTGSSGSSGSSGSTLPMTAPSVACSDFVFDSSQTAKTGILNISWPSPTTTLKNSQGNQLKPASYTFAVGSRTVQPVVIATSVTASVSINLNAINPVISKMSAPIIYFIVFYGTGKWGKVGDNIIYSNDGIIGMTTVYPGGCSQSGGGLNDLSGLIKKYGTKNGGATRRRKYRR